MIGSDLQIIDLQAVTPNNQLTDRYWTTRMTRHVCHATRQ